MYAIRSYYEPLFVGSEVYRQAAFGQQHPLSIIRVSGVVDVCRFLDWFDVEQYRDSPQATLEQLEQFVITSYSIHYTKLYDVLTSAI